MSVQIILPIRGNPAYRDSERLVGPRKKPKENCRHASAERSKAFSLQGKDLKANIQFALLLLQTPVTSRCSILACRLVQRRADTCLVKNVFLYSPQDAFLKEEKFYSAGLGGLLVTLLIRELPKSWHLLATALAGDPVCARRAAGCLSLPFFWNSFYLFVARARILFIIDFRFYRVNIISGIERVRDSLNRPPRTGLMFGGNNPTCSYWSTARS